jgi:hypothetical protein
MDRKAGPGRVSGRDAPAEYATDGSADRRRRPWREEFAVSAQFDRVIAKRPGPRIVWIANFIWQGLVDIQPERHTCPDASRHLNEGPVRAESQ